MLKIINSDESIDMPLSFRNADYAEAINKMWTELAIDEAPDAS